MTVRDASRLIAFSASGATPEDSVRPIFFRCGELRRIAAVENELQPIQLRVRRRPFSELYFNEPIAPALTSEGPAP